jgi:hypothetical protein
MTCSTNTCATAGACMNPAVSARVLGIQIDRLTAAAAAERPHAFADCGVGGYRSSLAWQAVRAGITLKARAEARQRR